MSKNPDKIKFYVKPTGNGEEIYQETVRKEDEIYDPTDFKHQDYSLMGKLILYSMLIYLLVHNNVANIGLETIQKEVFTTPFERQPIMERMPDNFRTETIFLSKWIEKKPMGELFHPLKRQEITPKNIASLMCASIINDLLIKPENTVTYKETNFRKLDVDQIRNAKAIWSDIKMHIDKDIFNPAKQEDTKFFEDLLESEYQSEIDLLELHGQYSEEDSFTAPKD
jgi:hypothetical protein